MTDASKSDSLTAQFEDNRPRLRAIAFRMLGGASEAEDAVQETWLRVARADAGEITNLGGWLTTVVSHVCLDLLRARKTRENAAPTIVENAVVDAEREILFTDAVGSAMMIVLDTLSAPERVAFVLHDLFAISFEDIGAIVGRSAVATRQLASRARRRVQNVGESGSEEGAELPSQREVAAAFMAASRDGDLDALLAVLDPDVVLRVDSVALKAASARAAHGAPNFVSESRGANDVARTFRGIAQAARPALVDGAPGAAWAPGGQARGLFAFKIERGLIVEVRIIADPKTIAQVDVLLLD